MNTLIVNGFISICAFYLTRKLIPGLSDMFIKANLFGNDLCKKTKPKL